MAMWDEKHARLEDASVALETLEETHARRMAIKCVVQRDENQTHTFWILPTIFPRLSEVCENFCAQFPKGVLICVCDAIKQIQASSAEKNDNETKCVMCLPAYLHIQLATQHDPRTVSLSVQSSATTPRTMNPFTSCGCCQLQL